MFVNRKRNGSGKGMESGRHWFAAAGLAVVVISSTGCQIDVGGQTLPSPYYLQDDVQYYAPGPEFKLSREAAAMKAFQAGETID